MHVCTGGKGKRRGVKRKDNAEKTGTMSASYVSIVAAFIRSRYPSTLKDHLDKLTNKVSFYLIAMEFVFCRSFITVRFMMCA
jgi:hypothetical protein